MNEFDAKRMQWNAQTGRLLTPEESVLQNKRWADEEAAARYNARADVQVWLLRSLGA